MNRPDVLALFSNQHWVASGRQLHDLGVSSSAIDRARARGSIIRLHPRVYQVAGVDLSVEGIAMGLQLLAGPTAFLSGPTAGLLRDLRGMPTSPIEVTIDERHQATFPRPHRLWQTSWLDLARDVEERPDGLCVARPLRMLFGLATRFNQHRFERAAEDAWHRGLVTPDEAADYLAAIRRSGKAGVLRMERWLQKTDHRGRPAQSGLERRFLTMFEGAGLPTPVRQHPLVLPSGELVHLDLAWPDIRLAIEPGHSWWHGGDLRQRSDQARDRACAQIGWLVHRYDESATDDPDVTAREIVALHRRRIADLGGSHPPLARSGGRPLRENG